MTSQILSRIGVSLCRRSVKLPQLNRRQHKHHSHNNHLHRPHCNFSTTTTSEHIISMPSIMEAKEGMVERWVKKEGDSFGPNDTICEATLSDLTIGIETAHTGILAKIVCAAGATVNVGEPIAIYVDNKDAYMEFFANQKEESEEQEMLHVQETLKVKPDIKTILREIKHMISDGTIKEGSDFAKKITSLSRKGDEELLSVFQSSCEGEFFNPLTFDTNFFIEQAKDIILERESGRKE